MGVYDVVEHHKTAAGRSASNCVWVKQWLGPRDDMAAISPVEKAERIQAPVFLAAGGKDRITPLKQTDAMEKALKAAGVRVETLYYPQEGHGFYREEHRRAFYSRLLNVFAAHLGGAPAK